MNSKQIKEAFAKNGVKVRVKAFDQAYATRFRICVLNEVPHNKEQSITICTELGLVDCFGKGGGTFNQAYEMFSIWKK